MRRFWILLIVAAMAMALAAPATGKKPDNPGKPNPGEALPQAGFSCAEYEKIAPESAGESLIWNIPGQEVVDSIEPFVLTSGESFCVDVSNSKPGRFEVDAEDVNGAKRNSILFALIKDSHPGDHCGQAEGAPGSALNLRLYDEDKDDFAGIIKDVPGATLNACGIEYSEADVALDEDGNWVVVNPTIDQNGEPDPLVLGIGITGKPGVTATVTITFVAD